MKKIISKLNSFYKTIIKKLNNFRLTAVIVSGVNLVAGLTTVGLLACYYFAFDVWDVTQARVPSFMQLGAENNQIYGKIMGMFFFLICIIVIGLSIATIYNALPNVKNKEKVNPKKSVLMFAFVNGIFQLPVLVFTILAITLQHPNTFGAYIATIPFTLITLILNILCIVPFIKCIFYQPKVGTKLIEKKEVAADSTAKAQ